MKLPAQYYDQLKDLAERLGGVGCGRDYRGGLPYCIHGMAQSIEPGLSGELLCQGLDRTRNDVVVRAWYTSHPSRASRMPWSEYVQAIGLERE
jgi:hypothetical protein